MLITPTPALPTWEESWQAGAQIEAKPLPLKPGPLTPNPAWDQPMLNNSKKINTNLQGEVSMGEPAPNIKNLNT